jgi:hypothetical protein
MHSLGEIKALSAFASTTLQNAVDRDETRALRAGLLSATLVQISFWGAAVCRYQQRRYGEGKKPQVPPLRSPGFPVQPGGVVELHSALFTESRTRGRWLVPRSRKSGYAPVGGCDFIDFSREVIEF